MGQCGSVEAADGASQEAIRRSKKLLAMIDADVRHLQSKNKLLLLGAGESGKSTVFKQMRIINASGYSEGELKQFKWIIHRNVLDAIKILIEQVHARDINLASDANEDLADQVLLWDGDSLNPEMAEGIATLWADPGVQAAFQSRAEYQLGDNAQVYLSDVKRIGAHGFQPTTDDALRARVRTCGVVSKDFEIDGTPYAVYDVGGQRSERRKWLPLFAHVTAIVFVAAISEYDQVVQEDRSKNRLHEALDLFAQIVNSKHFVDADVIIFLNKKDLFYEKIQHVDPGTWFPEYKGGCDAEAAEAFFKEQFRKRVDDQSKLVYMYTTCATDTGNMKTIFNAVTDMFASQMVAGGVAWGVG